MERVTDWTAKRAGGRITIHAKDDTDTEIKIVGVDQIYVEAGKVLADDRDGETYELVV